MSAAQDTPTAHEPTARERAAEAEAHERLTRRRRRLRPIGLTALVAVTIPAFTTHPEAALHGRGLAVLIALLEFDAAMWFSLRPRASWTVIHNALLTVALGSGALALTALQPSTGLAPSAAVLIAVVRLPRRLALPIAGALTAGLALIASLSSRNDAQDVVSTVLLCVLMAVMGEFVGRAGESQDQAELLYAQLQDARDAQAAMAASEERTRIATELHDVLAHSLSGAAIQLQGARKLLQRTEADPRVAATVDRASELVRGGLEDARRAVRALHGDEHPAVEELPVLLADFRRDQNRDVSYSVLGPPRTLPADASLALYRGAQEALTNIAKYAPGASVAVTLHHDEARTTLTIEDHHRSGAAHAELAATGGGFGLAGMRERVVRLGGAMDAGATDDGWRVRLEVPV